jgi:succinyl-CoA synthetase alpha subunit
MTSRAQSQQQKRSLHLTAEQSTTLLKAYNISVSQSPPPDTTSSHFLGITVDRTARSPCIIASPTASSSQLSLRVRRFPFDYRQGPSPEILDSAISYSQFGAAPPKARAQVAQLLKNLWTLYHDKEAITTTLSLALSPTADEIVIYDPFLFFDNAAYKSNKRQEDLHALRDTSSIPAVELEAEKSGIVYVPLASPSTSSAEASVNTQTPPSSPAASEPSNLIGTLVNGAGLAMNACDVLSLRLGGSTSAANFLDTGGKATAATISTSFKLILSDPRVSVVFVNIFGGLTLCDMIAEGIILAFKEVGVNKPVVVRLRGTNEKLGQEILGRANLPIRAFDDFEEAVREVGRLANQGSGS